MVGAAVLRGVAWADRRRPGPGSWRRAGGRWWVTVVLPSRAWMPLLRALIVFIVRWHG